MITNKFITFKVTMVTLAAIIISGCGGDASWKGEITAEYKITASATDKDATTLATGKTVLQLTDRKDEKGDAWNSLKMDAAGPLPDCRISFFPGNAKRDTPGGVRTAMVYPANLRYQVFTDDGKYPTLMFCESKGEKDGPSIRVDSEEGEITIDEGGKLSGVIEYTLEGSTGERRWVYFTGSKGWF